MSIKKCVNGSFVNDFYREYGTDTDTITSLPKTIIGDGTALSAWSMKGNMQQSGTPTPSTPIYPTEVGEKTANLFDKNNETGITNNTYINQQGSLISNNSYYLSAPIAVKENTAYTWQFGGNISHTAPTTGFYDSADNLLSVASHTSGYNYSFTTPTNCAYVRQSVYQYGKNEAMLSETPNVIPYEPYGQYKIPISFGQGTYTNYLAEPIRKINDSADTAPSSGTANRAIYKYVLTGEENITFASGNAPFTIPLPYRIERFTTLQTKWICSHYPAVPPTATWANYDYLLSGNANVQTSLKIRDIDYTSVDDFKAFVVAQYQAGTPITIWYILETATTETFTAPTIPTSGSPQSFDVDTTLKPSEVSLTYHGWHEHTDTKYTNP